MHISRQIITLVLLSLLFLPACRAKQGGSIEGTIVPRGLSARITVMRDNKDILTIPAGVSDGKFKLALTAGVYAIKVAVPGSPYPLQLNDISVKSGESTVLPPIDLTPALGTGALSGKIIPTRPDADVKLISEGRERAAVHTDREGRYEFKEVPAGSYVVQAHAPGHADDTIPVVITDDRMVELNAVLLPITSIDGVDWTSGKIHATGIGVPPQTSQTRPYAGKWRNVLPLSTPGETCSGS